MHTLYNFIIEPIGDRYNNKKQIGDKELILNTEIFNHQYVNREAKVIALPKLLDTDISIGDTVLVHHNIFRRWHDIRGVEKTVEVTLKVIYTLLIKIKYLLTEKITRGML